MVTQAEWVQCDGCEKWWMLPADVRAAGLPDSWRCAGASWNPVAAALGCGDAKPTRLKIGKHTAATGEHVEVEFSTGRFVGIVKKIHADKTFSVYFDVDDTAFVVKPGPQPVSHAAAGAVTEEEAEEQHAWDPRSARARPAGRPKCVD